MAGSANMLLGKLQEAHAEFKAAVKLSPHAAAPRFFLALSDYKQDNFANALNELQAAAQSKIVDSDVYYLMAECRLKLDPIKPQEAIVDLNRSIEINGRSVSARTLRGKLLLEGGNSKQACIDLELAHKLDPNLRSANYNLARAYLMLGRTKEAKAMLDQIHKESSDSLSDLGARRLKRSLAGNTLP